VWRDEWRQVQAWEIGATAGISAALFTSYTLTDGTPRWHGELLFDGAARRTLEPSTVAGHRRADLVSHVSFWSVNAYPFVVDAVSVAALHRASPEVAAQMVLIDAEAFAVNGFLFRAIELASRRARPFVADCLEAGGSPEDCGVGKTTSMPSGHVSTAATAAALICTHHTYLRLHDSVADPIACAGGIGLAVASSVSRIASQNHYATDVLLGAAIGVVSGWLVPVGLHYGFGQRPSGTRAIAPLATPSALGLQAVGAF
jgi:membrane-associated phospholipid phosphatase